MPNDVFKITQVKFSKDYLSPKRVRAMILNAMIAQGKEVRKDLLLTTQYWRHQVDFKPEYRYAGGDVRLYVYPYRSARGRIIWQFIDQGTSTIPVIFHPEYKPKTMYPGSLGTNWPGNKYNLPRYKIIGKKLFPTPPGIRPRHWTQLIRNKHKISFANAIAEAIKKGLQPK